MGDINLQEVRKHGTKNFPCAFYLKENHKDGLLVKHHWHNEFELIHLKKGKFNIEVNMDKHCIEEECLCFINSGKLHYIKSKYPCFESAIVFDLKMLSFDMFDSIQGKLIQPLLNGKLKFKTLIFKRESYGKEILHEYKKIVKAYASEGALTQDIEGNHIQNIALQIKVKASMLNILGILYENNLLIREDGKNKDYRVDYVKKVISYIQENYKEKIYIKDLAEQINMNEQYFCRFFKKMIGKIPMEYVNEYRIKKTKELLKETDMKIVDICLECGFNNIGNFIKVFKKNTSINPIKYRKLNKSNK